MTLEFGVTDVTDVLTVASRFTLANVRIAKEKSGSR